MLRGLDGWLNVYIQAHSGATISDMIHINQQRTTFLLQFDVIVHLIGTNDISNGASMFQIQQDFAELHKVLTNMAPMALQVICGILPRPCDQSTLVKSINKWLEQWCVAQAIVFLRAFSPFRRGEQIKCELYGRHQLHLNQLGKSTFTNFLQSQLGDRNLRKRLLNLRALNTNPCSN